MHDDDLDTLAAEYVLGTLSADERGHAEALLVIDPGFVEIVRQWERRLGELNVMVEAVEPPPEVWEKIRAEIDRAVPSGEVRLAPLERTAPATKTEMEAEAEAPVAALASSLLPPEAEGESQDGSEAKSQAKSPVASPAPSPAEPASPAAEPKIERSADVVYLARRVSHWRSVALGMGAIAVLLAIYVAAAQFFPGIIPLTGHYASQVIARSPAPTKPQGSRLVAVLQQEPTSPAFLLTVDTSSRTLTVRRISATPEAGRSYELWLISPRLPTPRSLGLVGDEEFTRRPLPADFDLDMLRAASLAISFEPAGGSPSGVPTGPILFTGKLVESLPASPPPT
jgi:anti-sigma-K factor RskA